MVINMLDMTEERNAFEAYMANCHPGQSLERYPNEGEYVDQSVQFGFTVWCTRSKAAYVDSVAYTLTFLPSKFLGSIVDGTDRPESKDPEFIACRQYLARVTLARRDYVVSK
jgi:hypothetical protein